MARIANFAALPQSIRDLEPQITRTITGRILGFAVDTPSGDPVAARTTRAAMLSCFCYAPTAPEEVLLEASARLAGWLLRRQASYQVNCLSGPVWHETRSGIHKLPGDAQRPSGKRRKRVVKPVQSSPGDRRSSTADTCASTRAGCRDNGHAVRMD